MEQKQICRQTRNIDTFFSMFYDPQQKLRTDAPTYVQIMAPAVQKSYLDYTEQNKGHNQDRGNK